MEREWVARADAELVRAALGGERGERAEKDAFAELITRHWAAAVALATRLLGSADLARDAAQEASIAALTGLGRLRDPERFGPWYCGIALNVARRWRRQLHAEPAAVLPDLASAEPSPAERAELAELALEVRAAVAQLAPGQRQAVLLFYLQGLTHREVAAELAISVGAVKARLHQARAALTPSLAPLIEEETMTTASSPAWIDVTVTEVRKGQPVDNPASSQGGGTEASEARPQHLMVLAERDGERRLPVWVGPAEAGALALSLEAQETPRPLIYQLAARLLEATGSGLAEVRITRLTEGIFYAMIIVDGPAGRHEIDARPSDAVNLAVLTGAPIRVDGALLDNVDAQGTGDGRRWQQLPARTAQIAAEARQEMRWPR
ncbi:MAG: bifunctional nuclease domain-containing protein [Streptosporangiaceae bacterium]